MSAPTRRIVRVFPRKTSMTPDDDYAFVGDPPLWRPKADEVHISVTFTWDIEEGQRLREAWGQHYPIVKLGGPAINGSKDQFVPGLYIKHGVTFTSRGCHKQCPWCLVPDREGKLKVLDIKPGWVIQDNNFLATPRAHQESVFKMLRSQQRQVSFPGGLDATLLNDWVIEQLAITPIKEVFLAADTLAMLPVVARAATQLWFLKRRQLRCYVLIGYGDETVPHAEERLKAVWQAGYVPFAQLFQPPSHWIGYSPEWKALARTWSRPAAMFALHHYVGERIACHE